ncbi:hypothetical protein PENTCL1PPCAC_11131, partial [Pristionchus entomophagus]
MESGRSTTILGTGLGGRGQGGGVLLLLLAISKLVGNLVLVEEIGQFAVLVHLNQDVASADKLAFHPHLRDGWPLGECLDSLSQLCIHEDIVVTEGDLVEIEHQFDIFGESASGFLLCSLHEDNDGSLCHHSLDLRPQLVRQCCRCCRVVSQGGSTGERGQSGEDAEHT